MMNIIRESSSNIILSFFCFFLLCKHTHSERSSVTGTLHNTPNIYIPVDAIIRSMFVCAQQKEQTVMMIIKEKGIILNEETRNSCRSFSWIISNEYCLSSDVRDWMILLTRESCRMSADACWDSPLNAFRWQLNATNHNLVIRHTNESFDCAPSFSQQTNLDFGKYLTAWMRWWFQS